MDGQAFRMAGRRAFITGGASGIGRAAALRLAAEGAVVVVADIRGAASEETARLIRKRGGRALAVRCDVGEEPSVADAAERGAEFMEGLDTVVVCSAVVTPGQTHMLSLADWELVIRVNLTGAFLTLKHTIPHLLEANGGSIVTVGSVASFMGIAAGNAVSYAASKGGLLQLTRNIAVEYARHNIRANCVCPGWVNTPILEHARELAPKLTTPVGEPFVIEQQSPMGRSADPDEVAQLIAFMASAESSFITGTAAVADGGYSII